MEKENQNKAGITAADVIKSDAFKSMIEQHLATIREKIEEVQKTLIKAGERLRRTPYIRLNELGLLKVDAFIDAYTCIVAKEHVNLPSVLRNAIKVDGDYVFVNAYAKLIAQDKQEKEAENE